MLTQETLKKIARFKRHYRPGRNQLCLCGSEEKYKRCCAPLIDKKHSGEDLLRQAGEYFKRQNYPEAEKYFRAHLTQYLIWYKEHTEPLFQHDPKAAEWIVSVDIEAIIGIALSLSKTLHKLGKDKKIIVIFRQLAVFKINPIYCFYIDCQKAFWTMPKSNKYVAHGLLDRHGISVIESVPMTDTGIMSLSMFLDQEYCYLPAHVALMILEKILGQAISPFQRADLLTKKIRVALLQDDVALAKSAATNLLDVIKTLFPENSKPADRATLQSIAEAYHISAVALEENKYYHRAITVCKEALKEQSLDPEYDASLHYLISKAYAGLGDHTKSIDLLHCAIKKHQQQVYWLDLAQELLVIKKIDESYEALMHIEYPALPEPLKIDYVTYEAHIAAIKNDRALASTSQAELEAIKVSGPYFQLLINSTKAILSDFSARNQEVSIFSKARIFISKYIILQPNFCGIGINLNEIIKPKEESLHQKKELT